MPEFTSFSFNPDRTYSQPNSPFQIRMNRENLQSLIENTEIDTSKVDGLQVQIKPTDKIDQMLFFRETYGFADKQEKTIQLFTNALWTRAQKEVNPTLNPTGIFEQLLNQSFTHELGHIVSPELKGLQRIRWHNVFPPYRVGFLTAGALTLAQAMLISMSNDNRSDLLPILPYLVIADSAFLGLGAALTVRDKVFPKLYLNDPEEKNARSFEEKARPFITDRPVLLVTSN